VENFGGDLELKILDLTWRSQVDLTAATLRSTSRLNQAQDQDVRNED